MGASGSYAPPKGVLFVEPQNKPLINGAVQPFAQRYFYLQDGVTQAPIYQDGYLQTPFTQPVVADAYGRFPAIYLDSSIIYQAQLYNLSGTLLESASPVVQQPINISASTLATAVTAGDSGASVLSLPATQPGLYAYEFYGEVTSTGTSPEVEFAITYTGSLASGSPNTTQTVAGAGAPFGGTINNYGNPIVLPGGTGRTGVWIRGVINASTAGTFVVDMASLSAGVTVQLQAGSYFIVQPVTSSGIIFKEPQNKPLAASSAVTVQPYSNWQFYYTGSSALAPVYADAALQRQLSQLDGEAPPSCTADINGRFSPIYLDPAVTYKAVLYSAAGVALETIDPYVPRSFEPITAVKIAPTIRATGAGQTADPALQITLNPGVYQLESILEFTSNGTSLTVPLAFSVLGGSGSLATTNTANSAVWQVFSASGGLTLSNNLTVNLVNAPSTLTALLVHGSITVTGGTVTFGLTWSPAGAAGAQVALNAGSYLMALPVG